MISVKEANLLDAANTLALSFMKDPLSCWVFQEEDTRYNYLMYYFRFRIRYGLKYGEVYSTSTNFEGVAMWLPGTKAHVTQWRGMRAGGMSLYYKMGKELMNKFNYVNHHTADFRNSLIQPPYYQLSPIGVKPEHQGKGFASKLLKPMFERFDEQKEICFLETQTESNIPIYQKYGFKIMDKFEIPKTNLHHWGMIRKPFST